MPPATRLSKLLASPTHKPTKPTTLNLHTKASATRPSHPSSRQSMLDSSRGPPHLDVHSVRKYLFASSTTSKGHMKQPCEGIWSTCTTKPMTATKIDPLLLRPQRVEDHTMPGLSHPHPNDDVDNCTTCPPPHLVQEFDDFSIAIIFCFGAFADKLSGVVYNNCTSHFPYMPLDGNICFLSWTTMRQTQS